MVASPIRKKAMIASVRLGIGQLGAPRAAQFAEPVLFGRVIDTLTGAQTRNAPPDWPVLSLLLGAWAGFGIFTMLCGTLVALYADRLSPSRPEGVLTRHFAHVLRLSLSFYNGQ